MDEIKIFELLDKYGFPTLIVLMVIFTISFCVCLFNAIWYLLANSISIYIAIISAILIIALFIFDAKWRNKCGLS